MENQYDDEYLYELMVGIIPVMYNRTGCPQEIVDLIIDDLEFYNGYLDKSIMRAILLEKTLNSNDKVVFSALTSLATHGNMCIFSYKYIADYIGLSSQIIKRSVDVLIDKGYITLKRPHFWCFVAYIRSDVLLNKLINKEL